VLPRFYGRRADLLWLSLRVMVMNHNYVRSLLLFSESLYLVWLAAYPYLMAFSIIIACLNLISYVERGWINTRSD
jgi:hypothetical protein